MLSANAIVREKENGTLEQLFMTPVRPGELILGKMIPYLVLTIVEFCIIAFLMRIVFQVPIHGVFLTLLAIALPFVLAMLGLGLWISTQGEHHARRPGNGHGHGHAVDLPVGLRLPARLDAVVLPVRGAADPDDLADRRVPRRHPARRRLGGAVAARFGSLGHGARCDPVKCDPIPQAVVVVERHNGTCNSGRKINSGPVLWRCAALLLGSLRLCANHDISFINSTPLMVRECAYWRILLAGTIRPTVVELLRPVHPP